MPPAVSGPDGPTVSALKAMSTAPFTGFSFTTCLRTILVTLVNWPPA